MGIQGLLPLLKSIMSPIHIKDLQGCSVAVDTYSWLHKGALSCSKDLCKGTPTTKHIDYCMHRVNLMRHYGVIPILVFDGGLLPMKSEQENKRARSRKENLARAIEHETAGNASAAYECYQKAVDISPSVAYELIQVLKQENVNYVVAPYEADAQMTFLALSKLVDAVITEDSDLIPFGCPRIIYKMDKFGQGVEFQYGKLQYNKELSFSGFSKQMLLEMCVLSGCDYLQSLPGMGLKKAHTLIKKFRSYEKVIKHLKFSGVVVPPLYEESFLKAIMTFQHQRVYDPVAENIVHLSDPSDITDTESDFLGPWMPQHIAKGIATGDIDPLTQLPFEGVCMEAAQQLTETYKYKSVKPEEEKKKVDMQAQKRLDLPAQRNLLTNYFCFASIEAKRKFRAPRVSPKQPDLEIEFQSPGEVNGEVHLDHVDSMIARKASVLMESFSHVAKKHSIQPCTVLQKERECSSISVPDECKMRIEKKNIVVRSSYFKQKPKSEMDVKKKNACQIANGGTSGNTISETSIPHCDPTSALEGGDGLINKHDNSNIGKNQYLPGNECIKVVNVVGENKTAETKPKADSRKVTVSPYFSQKTVREDNQENRPENLFGSEILADNCEMVQSTSGANDFVESTTKRKVPIDDNLDSENQMKKYMRTSGSVPSKGNILSEQADIMTDMRTDEGKFGCDISHLGQYSDIAEKSIEKFAAVISAFRCNSSGSRASGIRAPLKDIKNTCSTRSSGNMDLSKFAYVPAKQKAPALRRL